MTMAGAVYFLLRIWSFPQIGLADALLMGIALTAAAILCAYGIVSGRGTIPESALLVPLHLPTEIESNKQFAYVVFNIYCPPQKGVAC
jgi:hypothetical protein